MGPPGGLILGPHAQLSKRTKEKHVYGPFLGPSGGTKNETAKSQNPQQRPTLATNKKLQLHLFKQPAYRFGTEEARTCEASFQLTFRPRNGIWKCTCGINCLRSLAPMWRFAMQHHPGNIHQSFAAPRYSATPCYVLIQVPNVIDTISKRWRSKKASNFTFPHLFLSRFLLHPV